MIKINRKASILTRDLLNSKLMKMRFMLVIINIDDKIEMEKLYHRSSLTLSTIIKVINELEKIGLIETEKVDKRRIIIPTEALLYIRELLINLVREVRKYDSI